MSQHAMIRGEVCFRAGDGVLMPVPDGDVDIEVAADSVTLLHFALHQRRMVFRIAAKNEEGGGHTGLAQDFQDRRGHFRFGTVVKGDDNFAVGQRRGAETLSPATNVVARRQRDGAAGRRARFEM